ncbi:MAG: hypothetical protein J7604_25835 [Sporocytophaga sp.]|uniref:hypothetical protein n=1 Tax=Sporocytophaga sp. TaxID=2231183 RepID=UPI001AFE6DC9|nr:hypothetical protein [Sporocytophaga sp.]MBO9703652.1 hypothetical protein [Sporocytophaga sp.]
MLRTYKPLDDHPVFEYQEYIQHLICEVWCNAQEPISCYGLLNEDVEKIYNARDWVKNSVDEIYELSKSLTEDERAAIREAFILNNGIENLCEAISQPVSLDDLPNVVKEKMKDFLVKCYSDLITAKEKLDYYNNLIYNNNNLKFCPCCGLVPIESGESRYREDNDHFLPKEKYPFASVNFSNLTPLCSKCNKKCKSTKNPCENNRRSFYAFKPLPNEFEIGLTIKSSNTTNYGDLKQEEVELEFNNDAEKVDTWNWLFDIKNRYNEEVRQFSKTELRTIANRFKRNTARKEGATYEQILNDAIEDYHIDRYDDRKFLKLAFLKEILLKPEWMAVYS